MICQECQQRPATVHYTKVVNGQKTEYHLCEQCAREKGEFDLSFGFDPGFSIHNLLAGLLDMEGQQKPSSWARPADVKCPTCGLSYSEFSRTGRLGCSDCYLAFDKQLEPLLRRIHGSSTHNGKIPERSGGLAKVEAEIRQLSTELQQAVEREDYERAAELRDQIKQLKSELEQGQGGK
jgi:protein arginine kinase activator